MKRILISLVIVILVAALCGGLIWFNFFRDTMIAQFFANFPIPTVTVSTVEVTPQRWAPGIDAVGTVSASEGVDVAGQVSGVVTSIAFKANDKVAAGDLLVQLDDSVERATHFSAQSTVKVSQDALDRAKQLFEKNFATAADLQAAQNKFDLAMGLLNQVEANLAQRAIKAPFAGTIGIPRVDVGQYAQAGTVIATLQNLDQMRVDFTVPEQQLPQLELGQEVSIGLTEDHLDLRGAIVGIDPKTDPNSRLVSIQALVDNANVLLRPGQFARVRVHLPEEPNVIALPQTAVIISLYGSYVSRSWKHRRRPRRHPLQEPLPEGLPPRPLLPGSPLQRPPSRL